MAKTSAQKSQIQIAAGLAVLIAIPCLLSLDWLGTLTDLALLAIVFAFPGYLALWVLNGHHPPSLPLGFAFGLALTTTVYDLCARHGLFLPFLLLTAAAGIAGLALWVRTLTLSKNDAASWALTRETVLAGVATALCMAAIFWRSARVSGGEMAFWGVMDYDHFGYLTMSQRLVQHVPPDNWYVSGVRPRLYHYANDLVIALIYKVDQMLHLNVQLFDLYFRSYPTFFYFALGAFAYGAGRSLLHSVKGGILAMLVLLGAGSLFWMRGLHVLWIAISQHVDIGKLFFSQWTWWEVDEIDLLIHRSAAYHGELFALAAINLVLPLLPGHSSRGRWISAGLMLGMMAAFNYTLGATFGVAAFLAALVLFLRGRRAEALDAAWMTAALFLGALPKNLTILLDGFRDTSAGSVLTGPNLDFPVALWAHPGLSDYFSGPMIEIVSLLLFVVFAYGIRLAGFPAMARGHLQGVRNDAVGHTLALLFLISFVMGCFFTYGGVDGVQNGFIFVEPTLWMSGFFALSPILSWMNQGRAWRSVAIWTMLGVTWIQALAWLNFSDKIAFTTDTLDIFQQIRQQSTPEDVVAYLPTYHYSTPVLGDRLASPDRSPMAMTGLDGYFANRDYTLAFAVPGMPGKNEHEIAANARALYDQRFNDVKNYLRAEPNSAEALQRLVRDRVHWIILQPPDYPYDYSPLVKPWRQDKQVIVFRLPK